jgi:glutamate racemase
MAGIIRQPIGILDSGLGGLTVLADLVSSLPGEHYIYYADTQFAPYGEKPRDTVQKRVMEISRNLCKYNIKILVIACNTATSAAAEYLRSELTIPVVGMEPALKQAVTAKSNQTIVVAATPLTIKAEKFTSLFQTLKGHHRVIPMPCYGLVELIESAGPDSPLIDHKLQDLMRPYANQLIHQLVLGCTHYVLIHSKWQHLLGPETRLVDGNAGTVRQTLRLLSAPENIMPNEDAPVTEITLKNSDLGASQRRQYREVLLDQLKLRNIMPEIITINEE